MGANSELSIGISMLRGMACLCIVGVHVSANAYQPDIGEFTSTLAFLINQFGRVGTPVFAFLSALLLFGSLADKGHFNTRTFFTRRFTKVFLPYIICSIGYLVFRRIYMGESITWAPMDTLHSLLFGRAFYHLYFIYTILQFYLLFPLLARIKRRGMFLLLTIASLVLTLGFSTRAFFPLLYPLGEPGLYMRHGSFILHWLFFFMAGGCMAYYYPEIKAFFADKGKLLVGLWLLFVGLVWLSLEPGEVYSSHRTANVLLVPGLCVTSLMLLQRFVHLAPACAYRFWITPAKNLGRYSMSIYFLHPALIVIMAFEFGQLAWQPLFLLPCIFFVTAACCGITLAVNRFVPRSQYMLPVAQR